MTHSIKIGNETFANVGKIDDEPDASYYYAVTTLDGKFHQSLRYKKVNKKVQFFNLLDGQYEYLKTLVKNNQDTPVTCGFPSGDGYVYDSYYMNIDEGETNKGWLNGVYIKNGLTISFTKENADE